MVQDPDYEALSSILLRDLTTLIPDIAHQISDRALYSSGADVYRLKDHVECDKKPLAQHSSNNNLQVPPCEHKDKVSHSSFPVENGLVVVRRDDDENSSGCTHPSSYKKPFRQVPYIGDRRIRKVLAPQSCKEIPRYKNKFKRFAEPFQTNCQDNDSWDNHQKCLSFSDKDTNRNGNDCLSRKILKEDSSGHERFTSAAVARSSFQDVNSHVKHRNESFRVPELLIEMPETSTIGSLKRAVVEAVTTILGGGLHVVVLLQGKKVGDETKTLQQTGISHDRSLDALSFMLEPDPANYASPVGPRYTAAAAKVQSGARDRMPEPRGAHSRKLAESDRGSSTSPMNMLTKGRTESKTLVPISSMNAGASSAVPLNRKPKQSEIAQRRIRRPFLVAEVEELVQDVEKLGTGRWRDVKLRAFGNTKCEHEISRTSGIREAGKIANQIVVLI